ncbi:MAG TPA: hypothetical protein VGP33_02335, partial [Chloroflexota bacterium]|nr:hypothetical protein [Chloroflexota bacterium]
MNSSPTRRPLLAGDPVLTALQRSADLLDSDASAVPTAAFQQRARLAVLQAAGIPRPVASGQQLLAKLGSAFDRRRLVGVGVGAALLGMVAVPAMAAPSPLGRTVRGAVGAAIGGVPALFVGAPSAAPTPAIDTDRDERITATTTSSALSAATDADATAQGLGATISTIARSTIDQGEAHGAAVSSAAHSLRLFPGNLSTQSAKHGT